MGADGHPDPTATSAARSWDRNDVVVAVVLALWRVASVASREAHNFGHKRQAARATEGRRTGGRNAEEDNGDDAVHAGDYAL